MVEIILSFDWPGRCTLWILCCLRRELSRVRCVFRSVGLKVANMSDIYTYDVGRGDKTKIRLRHLFAVSSPSQSSLQIFNQSERTRCGGLMEDPSLTINGCRPSRTTRAGRTAILPMTHSATEDLRALMVSSCRQTFCLPKIGIPRTFCRKYGICSSTAATTVPRS